MSGKLLIPKYPILFCHGLFGFGEIGPIIYFHKVIRPLKSLGVKVEAPEVHPTDSIKNRAKQLFDQMNEIKKKHNTDKVHIIAHSMGGLDARYLISLMDCYHPSVLSLTTVGTPHHGSHVATYCDSIFERIKVEKLLSYFKIPFKAINELRPDYINEEFNPLVIDSPYVKYYSIGAYCDKPKLRYISPLVGHFHKILRETEGANDGLVSLASAKWGAQFDIIKDCDHRDLIGWSNFDNYPIYLNAINRIYTLEKEMELQEKGLS